MWKILTLVVATILLSGCNVSWQKAGIEIISYPSARVFIDNREVGTTPYKNNTLKPGEISLKLVTDKNEWTKKIRLENGVNTVVNREIKQDSGDSGGYILYFESTGDKEKAGLMISSNPDRATVAIDDEIKGYTPIRIADIGDGDKKLTISFPGFKGINAFVKFVNGYQLVTDADLTREEMVLEPEMISPIATVGANTVANRQVLIKETETGWLRVRSEPTSSSAEVGRVVPGSKHILVEEKNDWLKIELDDPTKQGWISSKYAEKL